MANKQKFNEMVADLKSTVEAVIRSDLFSISEKRDAVNAAMGLVIRDLEHLLEQKKMFAKIKPFKVRTEFIDEQGAVTTVHRVLLGDPVTGEVRYLTRRGRLQFSYYHSDLLRMKKNEKKNRPPE